MARNPSSVKPLFERNHERSSELINSSYSSSARIFFLGLEPVIRRKVPYRIGYHPLRTPSRIVTSKEVTEPARQRPFRQRIIDKNGQMRTGLARRDLEA